MSQVNTPFEVLGKGRKLIEGLDKVTGRAQYVADIQLPNMLHARPVLSPYAHAKIVSIDSDEARQVPGVVAVLTAEDLPTKDRVMNSRHSAILARERVLFRGQPVVIVVAETEAAAKDGADAVLIDYEPLPAVIDIESAIAPDAPILWPEGVPSEGEDMTATHAAIDKEEVKEERAPSNIHEENRFARGDVEKGLAEADVVVDRTYTTPIVHQSYLEPFACVVDPDPYRGSVTVYASTQGQFTVRNEVARLLSLPQSKVKVVPMAIGGGFGAKHCVIEPTVAAVAVAMRRPVKLVMTRGEDFLSGTPSPATIISVKTGAKKDGTITALQAKVFLDNGIFPYPLSGIVSMLLGGYYKCENVEIECFEVLTNKPQAGAYRAPGAPSATLAIESNIDEMASLLGLDPLEFRYQNAVEGGDPTGIGAPWPEGIGMKACLERLRAHPAWQGRNDNPNEAVGIAVGGWPTAMGPAASVCRVGSDGVVSILVGSVDVSGVNSSLVLVAAEILTVSPDQVELLQGDTSSGPPAPASGGSQVTYSVSAAVAAAAQEAKRKILELASDHFEARVDDLELVSGKVQVKGVPSRAIAIGEVAAISERKAGGPGPIIGDGTSAIGTNSPGFVAHLVRIAVDPDTAEIELKQYVSVQDVGFALNPLILEGQIHGGMVQGLGWGLHEAMRYDEHGQLLSASFMDYDLPKFRDVPRLEAIMLNNPSPFGPFGARGIGEPPITAGAAAIANAVKAATGVRVTELPIRPEVLWKEMQEA
jgi:CO/xanthine dehydrogenase Mo-binding subunit